MARKHDLAGEVFTHLADAPDGLTLADLSEKTLRPLNAIRRAIRTCRLTLAAGGDTLFIVADPQGLRQPWLYRLVDGSAVVDAEESGWTANRIADSESRLRLINAGLATAVAATRANSTLGQKARTLQMHLGYIVQVLDNEALAEQVRLESAVAE